MGSKSVQKRFHDWCDITSSHAIPDWHKAETKCGKFFWILVLILVSIICTYEICTVLLDFTSNDKYNTQIYYEPVEHLEFPAITVCYGIPWSKRAMERLNMSSDALEYFSQIFIGSVNRSITFDSAIMFQMRDAYEAWESSPQAQNYCTLSNRIYLFLICGKKRC